VVAQDHGRPVADAREQAGGLVGMDRDALEVVVRQLAVQLGTVEVGLLQAAQQTGHRHAGRGVGVHDAMGVGYRVVDGGMYRQAGRVDRVGRAVEHIALDVDLDQVAGGDSL
jgi:hypothetical protein